MSTDETELTFIRCPGCRSLVPAIAARCRMCGYQFDDAAGENGGAAAEGAKQKGRVRQRTISVETAEVDAVKKDQLPSSEEQPPAKPPEEPPEESREKPQEPFRLDKGRREPAEPEVSKVVETVEPEPRAAVAEDKFEAQPEPAAPAVEPEPRPEPRREPTPEPRKPEPEVASQEPRVEQSASVEQSPQEEPETESRDEFEVSSEAPEARGETRRRRRRRKKKKSPRFSEAAVSEEADTQHREEGVNVMSQSEGFVESAQGVGGDGSAATVVEPRPTAPMSKAEGTLLGWIVNFSLDPKGVGSELRCGQFFVGRQRLRNSDMVIADSSISTPHCLVYASVSEGLRVQDLMSEQGTYIRRRESDSWTAVSEPTDVKHGDWLRFGAYEVMVCLVPGAGRR